MAPGKCCRRFSVRHPARQHGIDGIHPLPHPLRVLFLNKELHKAAGGQIKQHAEYSGYRRSSTTAAETLLPFVFIPFSPPGLRPDQRRLPSAISDSNVRRSSDTGPNAAISRPRSVTTIRRPPRASFRYSLSRAFSSRIPTVCLISKSWVTTL